MAGLILDCLYLYLPPVDRQGGVLPQEAGDDVGPSTDGGQHHVSLDVSGGVEVEGRRGGYLALAMMGMKIEMMSGAMPVVRMMMIWVEHDGADMEFGTTFTPK